MKRTLFLFALLLLGCNLKIWGQELVLSLPFETRFDNREYSPCDYAEGFTLFGMGFSPEVGVQWAEKNRLMVGAKLTHEFGDEKGLSEAALMVYYQFQSPQVTVNAGIFPRGKLIGNYSEAFFDDKTSFYHDPLQGILVNYRSPNSLSYAEFWIDWEGLRTETQREKFRINLDGRWDNGRFYAGGTLMMLHYARSYTPEATLPGELDEGVVDNMLLNPHVGVRVGEEWQFEARLGYLQALQQDRRLDRGWESPKGGELWLSLGWKGFTLDNKLYVGENLLPLFSTYGFDLYECSTFYGVEDGIYNRTALRYGRTFFEDTLSVDASLVVHYDGEGCGLQQLLKIGVNLEKVFSKKKK